MYFGCIARAMPSTCNNTNDLSTDFPRLVGHRRSMGIVTYDLAYRLLFSRLSRRSNEHNFLQLGSRSNFTRVSLLRLSRSFGLLIDLHRTYLARRFLAIHQVSYRIPLSVNEMSFHGDKRKLIFVLCNISTKTFFSHFFSPLLSPPSPPLLAP